MPQPLTNPQSTAVRRTGSGPGGGRHRGRRAEGEACQRGSGTVLGSGRHRKGDRAAQPLPAVDGQVPSASEGPALSAGGDEAGPAASEACFERDVLSRLDAVYRAASSVTGDPAESERLVLEVFTRAYAAFPRLLEGVDHQAWLYDLLAGAFIGPHPEVCVLPPESGVPRAVSGPALDAFVGLPEPDVRAALLALPKEQRFAVYLAAVEGYAWQEIADIMDVSPSIVAYWLHDARLRLWATAGPGGTVLEAEHAEHAENAEYAEYLDDVLVGAGRPGPA
ncbi:sigma factor-like helix-turn-helix DNA-binding protein [Actinacidiphila sp. bgisy167]|uniref:sigma factor-like helix-turn-helix DNA-binding protein n=1 Tax=Actinacidiphila sp. bgisy167 TaxID=3413797 RepID=UPI003D73D959